MIDSPSIYPPALKKGDKIGIVSPAGWHDMDKLAPAIKWLEQYFEVIIHEQNSFRHGQFAGTPQQRANALHDYFKDDLIKAIFCTRGGNGTVHLLDLLDYNLIKQNPKILIGFSNITTLLNAVYARTSLVTFHGPMLVSVPNRIKPEWAQQMIDVLTGKSNKVSINTAIQMSGRLLGGNLSDMQSLIGTPYAPDLKNAVLMLEDINEHTSRESENPFGFTIEEIIANNAPNTALAGNSPIGHGDNLCTLPIGAEITLKNGTLSFKSLA